MIYNVLILIILIVASYEDIKKRQVSNFYFFLFLILSRIMKRKIDINLIIYIIFLIIIKNIFDKNIGYGDIKILIGIALVSGYEVSIISFIIAGFISVIYMLAKQKKRISFIPFITIAYFLLTNINCLI